MTSQRPLALLDRLALLAQPGVMALLDPLGVMANQEEQLAPEDPLANVALLDLTVNVGLTEVRANKVQEENQA